MLLFICCCLLYITVVICTTYSLVYSSASTMSQIDNSQIPFWIWALPTRGTFPFFQIHELPFSHHFSLFHIIFSFHFFRRSNQKQYRSHHNKNCFLVLFFYVTIHSQRPTKRKSRISTLLDRSDKKSTMKIFKKGSRIQITGLHFLTMIQLFDRG